MEKHNVLFFTGAGISVASGIPTFQEQPGIRDKLTRSFANEFPEEYKDTVRQMIESCENAEPNDAHLAIAELDCPVITMNVDRLHTKAGSENVIELHGQLPTKEQLETDSYFDDYDKLILYGDHAPKYETAMKLIKTLEYNNSYFVIVGTSFYTGISQTLHNLAKQRHATILVINEDAIKRVPIVCKNLKRIYTNLGK